MIRKIIKIDSEKCSGCGLCVKACHEGAIGLKNGKAVLLREDYCDGLGDCLPACPENAISFEEREALPYSEREIKASFAEKLPCGCPGSAAKKIRRSKNLSADDESEEEFSELGQWPVQIKLVSANAACFDGADILIAADCTAYAYGAFHKKFMRGKVTLIGCPKLDAADYSEKLAVIFSTRGIKSVTVARMQVPCCAGMENMVKRALEISGKNIPLTVCVISSDGKITGCKNGRG